MNNEKIAIVGDANQGKRLSDSLKELEAITDMSSTGIDKLTKLAMATSMMLGGNTINGDFLSGIKLSRANKNYICEYKNLDNTQKDVALEKLIDLLDYNENVCYDIVEDREKLEELICDYTIVIRNYKVIRITLK